jgi:uncharacterized protein (DUF362 family)
MGSGVLLKKVKLSASLLNNLRRYYGEAGLNSGYLDVKWGVWVKDPALLAYAARGDDGSLGWIVYNSGTSTIEEILPVRSGRDGQVLTGIVDALIARKNLVAAHLLKDDLERYRSMVAYGFRPTKSFFDHGFPVVRLDLSTAVLCDKLKGCRPWRLYGRKERVAIERVPETQTDEEIGRGLTSLIDKLGGLHRFVLPDQTVVIKPNIVSDHGLKDGIYKGGIVTDMRVIKALVQLLLPVAKSVTIAEGSSINRSETTRMFTHYGYDSLVGLDPRKVRLLDLNTDRLVEKQVPGGKRMLSRRIPVTLSEADVIINVPVMKIHFAAGVSLSIKSLQGAVPPLEKYMTHFFGLWQNLVNIHHLIKPKLIIIDGLTGQEDFGPVSGTPKKMDLLIGGTNPVAVDAVAMRVMGLEPAASPPVWMAYMQGLGPMEEEKIEIIGPPVEQVARPFSQPELNLESGKDVAIHTGGACGGCAGYLHFVLSKLRRPDPQDPARALIDRPFGKKVNIFLGPHAEETINPEETNIFMGICQQHRGESGTFLPGCPPHAEVIVNGIFSLFPDVDKPKYADESEEKSLGEMLGKILAMA